MSENKWKIFAGAQKAKVALETVKAVQTIKVESRLKMLEEYG